MKRVLSFLMALVLTFGLIGMTNFSVFAATDAEIKIEVAQYKVGEPIPEVPQVTLYMPGTITEIAWASDYTGTFEDWGRYSFNVTLEAPEGQPFVSGDIQYRNVANSWCFAINYSDDGKQVHLNLGVETSYDRCYSFRLDAVLDNLQPGEAFTPNVYLLSGMAEVVYAQWVDAQTKMPVSYLEKGGNYFVEVAMRPAENFAFSENLYIEVNGRDLEYGFPNAQIVMPNNQELKLYLPFSFKEKVDSLTVQITEPSIGAEFSMLSGMADMAVFTSAKVYDGYTGEELTEGTFQEGYLYSIQYTFRPLEGYEFADWVSLDVQTGYAYSWGNDANQVFFDFYYQEGGQELQSISIDAPAPVPGTFTRDYKLEAPEGAPYKIVYVGWTDLTTDSYSPKEFMKNHRYLRQVQIMPAPGYSFSGQDFQVFINGESVRWYGSVDCVHVQTEQVISLVENEQTIHSAEMLVDGIAVGAMLEDLQITIAEDAPYEIDYAYIYDDETWDDANILEDGKRYYMFVLLKAKNGYIFNEEMQIYGSADSYNVLEYGTILELVVPISFQKEEVYYLDFSGVEESIAQGNAKIPNVGIVTGAAHVSDVFWVNDEGRIVSEFTPGHVYRLAVQVTAEDGYRFPTDPYEMRIETGGRNIEYALAIDGESQVTVYFYYYDLLPAIERVDLQLTVPQVGMDVKDLTASAGDKAILTEINVYMYEQDAFVDNGVFEKGYIYQVGYVFVPAEGYAFHENMDVFPPEDFPYSYSYGNSKNRLDVFYTFSTCEAIPVVEITATMPKPGMAVEDCTISIPEGADYEIYQWYWMDSANWTPAQGVFEADKEYELNVYLEPLGDYAFNPGETVITLNGQEMGWYNSSGKSICAYYWHDFWVRHVQLGELPYDIQAGKAEIPTVEAESDDITITNVKWVDLNRKTVTKFVDGNAYYLAVTIQADEGKAFRLGDEFFVEHWNGYTLDYSVVDDDTIVAYFRYSLEPDVGDVVITPSELAVGVDIKDITANIQGNVQIEYISVSDMGNYEEVTEGKLEANKSYCIHYSFIPKEGYRYGDIGRFEVVTEHKTDMWGGQGYRVVELYFSTKQKITEVKIDLEGVGIGKKIADAKAKLPANAPYTVNLHWYDITDGWEPADENAVFQDGHKYEVSIDLVAKDNYVFANKCELTVNGTQKQIQLYAAGEEAYTWDTVSYLKPVDKIELPAVPASIKKGQTLPTEFAAPKNAPYTLTAEWGIYGEGLVEKASENGSYVLAFMVEAKEGYEFTNDVKVYVDGKEYFGFMPSGGSDLSLYFVYNVGMQEIDRIDLTTSTIAAGSKPGKVTAPKDANFTLEEFNWFGNMDGNIFEADSIDTFKEGMYVYFNAELAAKEGYAFASDLEIYVNGQKAGYVRYMNMGIYAIYAMELGKLGQQDRTEKLSTPKVTVVDESLTWDAVVDADGYEIYRSTKKSSGFKKIDTTSGTSYFDATAEGGKTYYYKVKAIYNANTKLNSSDSSAVSVDYKIAAPVISTEMNYDTGKTTIKWAKVSGAKSYDVYRATEVDGKYTKLGNTKNLSYTDSKATIGVEYYYKVVAVASSSKYNSGYSNIYMSYAIMARPAVKISVDEATGKPSLSWGKVSGAVGYRILRKLSGEEDYSVLTQVTGTSYKDTTAPLDSVCTYVVIAVYSDDYFSSAYSKAVEATVTFGRPVLKGSNNAAGNPVLTWDAIDGALKYEVLRSTSSSKGFAVIATVEEGNTYTDETATAGKTYYYQVVAVGANTKSKASASLKVAGTCAAPQIMIGRNAATGKLVVEWEKVSGAKSYEVYRATTADGKYTKIGTSKTTSYTDTKSEVGKTYYYKVLAVGSSKTYNSVYSNIESWSAVLARPTVKIAIDEASGKPKLSWSKISGATGYLIIRSISDWDSRTELTTVTGTSFTDATAPLDSVCSYSVIALYSDEQHRSVESEMVKATVTFGRPVLDGGINVYGQPRFNWALIDGALKYEVYRSTSSSKGYTLIATVEDGNAYTDETATAGKTYYYQVVAVGENTKSKASAYVKLTGTCAVPVVDSYTDGKTGKPVITWEKVDGAKSYDVYYATSANGTYKKLGNTKNLSYTDTKIAIGATRYYKVVAVGSKSAYNSGKSNMVVGMSFCASPDVKTKVDTATGKPSLSWSKVSSAASYRIFRIISTEGGDFVEIANITGTSFVDTTAPIDTLCYYMVQTMHKTEGLSSAFSPVVEVTSGIAQPKLSGSPDSNGQPKLTWQAIEGALKYEVYRSTSSSKGYTLVGTVEETTFTDNAATAGKTYYYKVVAVGSVGKSAESAYVKLIPTCAQPQLEVVVDAATGKPALSWNKIDGASKGYEIYRSVDGGSFKKLTTTKSTSYIDKSAPIGSVCQYQVRALGSKSSYNSIWSETKGAFVICSAPELEATIDADTGKPSLSWSKVSGATAYRIFRQLPGEDGFTVIAEITGTSYIDQTVGIDTKCIYKVMTVGKEEALNSVFTQEVELMSTISRTPIYTYLDESSGMPYVSWSPRNEAVEYELYRSTSEKSGYTLLVTTQKLNLWLDQATEPGKTYYYKVVSVSANGVRSPESKVVKLTTTCAQPKPVAEIDLVSGKPVLTWEKIPGASKGYEIYRSVNGGSFKKLTTTKSTTYTDTKAEAGKVYAYRVRALGSKSSYNSCWSEDIACVAICAQPKVTVKTDSKGAITVSWKKISGVDKYYLMYVDVTQFVANDETPDEEYIANNMRYVEISKSKTSYTFKEAQIGHAYIITMIAVPKNEEFYSTPSEPQYLERTCATPKIKSQYIQGYNSGDWADVEGADFYNIYCATSKNGEYEYIGYVENDSSFVHLNAVKGRTYYYKVTACTYTGYGTVFTESDFSNVISIKTKN